MNTGKYMPTCTRKYFNLQLRKDELIVLIQRQNNKREMARRKVAAGMKVFSVIHPATSSLRSEQHTLRDWINKGRPNITSHS